MLFLVGKNLSFFATADDIDAGDLSIFEGGVENNGDGFFIVDEVPDKVDVVVTVVDIDDGLKASILDISRFGDMFKFIKAIVFFCYFLPVRLGLTWLAVKFQRSDIPAIYSQYEYFALFAHLLTYLWCIAIDW